MNAPTPIGGSLDVAHATPALTEADRLMTVCNSCRYCEGLCAVFPAMEMRRTFQDGDLDYIANLCHACGACYVDCQFAPPHAFSVNVPKTLATVRADSYARYVWPQALAPVFARNGLWLSLTLAICVAGFIFGLMAWREPALVFKAGLEPGAFYRLMPHDAMAALFGAAFLYSMTALALSVRAFWRAAGPQKFGWAQIWRASLDAASLRYLDGGGAGCHVSDAQPKDRRRLAHHLIFYGMALCFAATSVATLYHYLLAREAPYPWWDAPVVLGTLGGLSILAGTVLMDRARQTRDPVLTDPARAGMENAFLIMLMLVALTGLAVLIARATPALGGLLALHLGATLAFFVTMPYGKFAHGFHRYAALVRYAAELRDLQDGSKTSA